MKKIYTLFIALFLLVGAINAQTPTLRSYEKAAKKAMETKDFYSAWKFYDITLEIDSSRINNMYSLGEAAREFKSYEVAQDAYTKVLASENKADYPFAEFWLAEVMQSRQNYDGAVTHYQNFLGTQVTPKGPTDISSINYSDLAMKRIEECNWAKGEVASPRTNFKIEKLGNGVNTPATEFAPVEHQEEVYYSALGYDKENFCPDPDKKVTRLYTPTNVNTSNPQIATINWTDRDDKSFIAHTTFNSDGSRIYFTRCKRMNASDFDCELYYIQDKNAEGKWDESKAVRLSESINLPGTTNTQPSVGFDETLGKELLFFVSDRTEGGAGGRGDLDLYCSLIEGDGSISAPVRLDINTDEDDITPFYNQKEKTLYFSSKGYRGFGGFDIYKSEKSGNNFSEPITMDFPLNSSYDDVYFSTDANMDNAYFSSNRLGVTYEAEGMETCCNDIFKLEYIKANLLPFTFNGLSTNGLDSCSVVLYDITTGDAVEVGRDKNLVGFNYSFPLDLERKYMVIATREGRWTVDTTYVSTLGVTESTTFETELNLFPSVDLISLTFDADTNEPLTGCTFILRDNKTGEILLETNRLDDNRIYEMLEFGKEYNIQATKLDYEDSEKIVFTTENLTTNKTFNIPLYLEPEEFDFSISLYFDNDEPDKRTRNTYSSQTYKQAYDRYSVSSKIEEFVRENTKGLSSEQRLIAEQETRDFFIKDVDNGMVQLNLFAQFLERKLPKGGKYIVDIEGFASPRAPSDYNKALTSRRVNSVEKYLIEYSEVLRNYIGPGKSLRLNLIPKGEEPAEGKGIPSQFQDPKSIFSIPASKQRKVEIVRFRKADIR